MTLTDFEKEFDEAVLRRGYSYYLDGSIISLEKDEEDNSCYLAEVREQRLYNVCIQTDESDGVVSADCDCPYEYGYCKHIAAVLYDLRDMKGRKSLPSKSKETLSSLIGKCSKNQLMEIILEHAKEDKAFGEYLKMKLSSSNDTSQYISNFKHILQLYVSNKCKIDKLVQTADTILQKAELNNTPDEFIRLYISMFSAYEKKYNNLYYDDEEIWELEAALDEYKDKFGSAVCKIIESKDKKRISSIWSDIFSAWCDDDSGNNNYRFFPALMQIASLPEYRKKLDEKLSSMYNTAMEYEARSIDRKRLELIKMYGTKDETEQFMNEHLSNPDFRLMAINKAISDKDYKKAEQLALEGEAYEKTYSGLLRQWFQKRHDIYVLSGEKDKLENICRRLILEGHTEYYNEWKSLIPESEIDAQIGALLNEKRNHSYEYIIVEENMTDKIYDLCCQNASRITGYFLKLKGTEFEKKGLSEYEKYLHDFVRQASNRSEYKTFCRILKKFSSDCGRKYAAELADELRNTYCRKPALLDELAKAGF